MSQTLGGKNMSDQNSEYTTPIGEVEFGGSDQQPRGMALAVILAVVILVNAVPAMNGFFYENVDVNYNNLSA